MKNTSGKMEPPAIYYNVSSGGCHDPVVGIQGRVFESEKWRVVVAWGRTWPTSEPPSLSFFFPALFVRLFVFLFIFVSVFFAVACIVFPPAANASQHAFVFSNRYDNESGVPCDPEENDLRLLDGLLQRGLYDTAIRFTEDRLQNSRREERTRRLAEKVYVLTRRGLFLPPEKRRTVIRDLEQLEVDHETGSQKTYTASDATRSSREKERFLADRFRFSLQLGISEQLLGELARIERQPAAHEFQSGDIEEHPNALLTRALHRCEKLGEEVTSAIAATSSMETLRELHGVSDQVQLRQALVWKSIALGFPPDSPERVDALNRVLPFLDKLAASREDNPTAQLCQLERIATLRLLGDGNSANERFNQLLQKRDILSPELRVRATIEGIRLFLARGSLEDALQWSQDTPKHFRDPEFALVRLEVMLAIWARALDENRNSRLPLPSVSPDQNASLFGNETEETEHPQNRIVNFAGEIERDYGPYWGRKAQILITQSLNTRVFEDALLYRHFAEDAYRRKRFSESLRYYDLAEKTAETSDQPQAAWDFALTAAVIEHQLASGMLVDTNEERDRTEERDGDHSGRTRSALRRFRELALKQPENEKAPETYLTAIDLGGRLLAQNHLPLEEYIELLKTYLKYWPDSPKSGQVVQVVAPMLERLGRFEEVLEIAPNYQGLSRTLLNLRELAENDRRNEALQAYRALIARYPGNTTVAERYGDLLAASEDLDELREALTHWRETVKTLKNQSGKHPTDADAHGKLLEKAEETVIAVHLKMGNVEQARKLIRLHRTLEGRSDSPERKKRFDALEREANRREPDSERR